MSPSKEPVPLHHSLQGPYKTTPTPSSSPSSSQYSHWVPPRERDALGVSDHRKESSVLIFYIPFWSLGGGKEKPSIGCSSPFNNLGEHLPTSPLGKRKNLPSPHAPPPPPSPIFDRQPLEPDRFCIHCTCLQLPATHGHPDWCAACGDSVEGPF